eukprot:gnl/TRDRNA2_/TRDRNA2_180695_c0_seq1.p1 gnl/TRDRNA2_/TRDRNA2_180695_c0~~gnl/TRDRNA2_/TRDRNA2_180695_c0_seq1.p1  ORF type:complete len:807 (+),score=165.92 gnl/TRDRNA2_/TRDRNA2_180695_c0_seq1:78-2423(+)
MSDAGGGGGGGERSKSFGGSVDDERSKLLTPGSGRCASALSNLSEVFLDDSKTGDFLKSIVDTTGLQAAWTKIGRRLQKQEQSLLRAHQRIEQVFVEFVPRTEYEIAINKHTEQIKGIDEAIDQLKERQSRIWSTVYEEHGPQLALQLEKNKAFEELDPKWQGKFDELAATGDKQYKELGARIDTESAELRKLIDEGSAFSSALDNRLKEEHKEWIAALEALSTRMHKDMDGELAELSARFANDLFDSGNWKAQIQVDKMCATVEESLLAPLRQEIKEEQRMLRELDEVVKDSKDQLGRKIKETSGKVKSLTESRQHDLEDTHKRIKEEHMKIKEVDAMLRQEIHVTNNDVQALKTNTLAKMNEFIDHVGKLHETVDDHEHCLKHYGEELENRSTKYDVLICQSHIEKCAVREDIEKQMAELQKVVNWQTSKLSNMGLGSSTGKRENSKSRKRMGAASRQQSMAPSMAGSPTMMSPTARSPEPADSATGDGGVEDTNPTEPDSPRLRKSSTQRSNNGGVAFAETDAVHPIADEGVEQQGSREDAGSKGSVAFNEQHAESEDHSYSDSESEDGSEPPSAQLLTMQLEGLAMGVVGLAHLALKEANTLGGSRLTRLQQVQEFLLELNDLRHWITHKTAPSGWSPAKLTTVALKLAHPPPDDNTRGAPQLTSSLKELAHQMSAASLNTEASAAGKFPEATRALAPAQQLPRPLATLGRNGSEGRLVQSARGPGNSAKTALGTQILSARGANTKLQGNLAPLLPPLKVAPGVGPQQSMPIQIVTK